MTEPAAKQSHRHVVNVKDIPQPKVYKSMAVVADNTVYVAGQLGKGPDGKILSGVREQAVQAIHQIEAILRASGSDLNHILQMGVYVTDISSLEIVSEVRRELIPADPPASFGVEVNRLGLGADLELQVIAQVCDSCP